MKANGDAHPHEYVTEPLTRRERDILELLPEGLTSKEMAERLTLATSSVRWYLQQIYSKLGVNSKHQALERAGQLGLLKSTGPLTPGGPSTVSQPKPVHKLPPNNLPAEMSSFIGRATELKKVQEMLLSESRLVTLTGTGGTGKTRLALKSAKGLLEAFADGVYLVELAPLSDPEYMISAIANVLGLHESPDLTFQESVVRYLAPKHVLLILDNCEHLLEECAQLVDGLLKSCPRLHLLATSREILGVEGERSLRVPPLEFPDVKSLPGLDQVAQKEAVKLFVERANQAGSGFVLDESSTLPVAQICQRLDGIPLALELAAARMRMMTVLQIAARLDSVFRLLTGGSRSALPRHQTLKATIDWSYALLSPAERDTLQRLSVFAGSWTLEAAEAVCAGNTIKSDEVLDLLGGLVDKSLVLVTSGRTGEGRYRMLEIVRQYAHDRLVESGEGEAVREQHLDYFLKFSRQAEPNLHGFDEIAWLDRVEEELPNLRLAMEWSLAGRVVNGLELAAALFWFWHVRNYSQEAIDWHTRLLAAEEALPVTLETLADREAYAVRRLARARALRIAFTWFVHGHMNEPGQIKSWLKESIAICRELGPCAKRDLAFSLRLFGNMGFDDQWLDMLQEGLALAREVGDPFTVADCLWAIGNSAIGLLPGAENHPGAANLNPLELVQESLDLSRQIGFSFRAGDCLWTIAFYYFYKGDLEAAKTYTNESLLMRRNLNDVVGIYTGLWNLGVFTYLQGDYLKAESLFSESSAAARLGNSLVGETFGTYRLSILARTSGDYRKATELGSKVLDYAIDLDNKFHDLEEVIISLICDLGLTAWAEGDNDLAEKRGSEALAQVRSSGISLGPIHYLLGKVALSKGDLVQAESYIMPLIVESSFYPDELTPVKLEKAIRLRLIALLASAKGQVEKSVVIFGAIHDWEACFPGYYCPKERQEYEDVLAGARRSLGESGFQFAWQKGQAMTLDQAFVFARDF
jgi:predicted ATPase/DNA-binding CsgD family transcriptional regulator